MPAASRPPLQPIEAGSVHLSEVDVLLLSRVAWLGLAAMERRDGCARAAFRDVVDELCRAAEKSRRRIEQESRRSTPGPGTRRARTSPAHASSAQCLTAREAAGMLGCDESYARRLAREGRLEARKNGVGAWEFEPTQVAAAVRERAGQQQLDQAA